MNWDDLCLALNTRFGRDLHSMLIRQFYHIYQDKSMAEYIEQFDQLLHQLLAHENKLTSAMITKMFIDGLKDDIKAAVIIHRPNDLDTACSLALLQEDVMVNTGRKESRRFDPGGFNRLPSKPSPLPLPLPPRANMKQQGWFEERKVQSSAGRAGDDNKLTALKACRRTKGLCFKCGERWGHAHKCANSVPLHLV